MEDLYLFEDGTFMSGSEVRECVEEGQDPPDMYYVVYKAGTLQWQQKIQELISYREDEINALNAYFPSTELH